MILIKGGVNIGGLQGSYPFGSLEVSKDYLCIKLKFFGNYKLPSDSVLALEPVGRIPIIQKGIQIHHTNKAIPEKLIFWHLGNVKSLMQKIDSIGFQPSAQQQDFPDRQGVPFKWYTLAIAIVIWNALFILDFIQQEFLVKPGIFALLALLLTAGTAFATIKFPILQQFFIKPDRSFGEIEPHFKFVGFITTFIAAGFLLMI